MVPRLITVLLALLCTTSIDAQNGFVQSYCYEGNNSLSFHDIILQNDTLIVYGRARNPETGQVGLYFSKMDTLGNILLETTHFDSTGDDYFFEVNAGLVECPDGGYVIAGKLFFGNSPLLIKLKNDGSLDFVQDYPDSTVYTILHHNLLATEFGFLSIGEKQQVSDGMLDIFVMRTDLLGNKIWEISYGEQQIWDTFRNIFRANGGNYYIAGGSGITSAEVPHITDVWGISKILQIDTSGLIIPYWTGELSYVGDDSGNTTRLIRPDYDGGWIASGSSTLVNAGDNFPYKRIEVVKRNQALDLEWIIPILEYTSPSTQTYDLIPGNNQDWITVGRYFQERDDAPGFYYDNGLIAKVSDDGELLWTRTDTLFYDITASVDHYLGGVVVLPSGSIIACGQVNSETPAPGKSYGWLIKVDKDGCIEPGCDPPSSSTRLLDGAEFDVFPNPVRDQLNVTGEGSFDLELLDANGRLLQSTDSNTGSARLTTSTYPAGSYYLRIKRGQRWALRKVVKQ